MLQRKWETFRRLSEPELRLALRAWILLLAVDMGLRFMPFRRLQIWLARTSSTPFAHPQNAAQIIQHSKDAVARATRYHWLPMTCLRRSLALQRLLLSQGLSTELRFGVDRQNGDFMAHAWLELDGVPVNEPETISERFKPLGLQEIVRQAERK